MKKELKDLVSFLDKAGLRDKTIDEYFMCRNALEYMCARISKEENDWFDKELSRDKANAFFVRQIFIELLIESYPSC